MTKFQNKYRIESTRIPEYDYSNPNWYYVTINTKNHICYFGEVSNGKMILNELGKIVETEWFKNAELRENIELDYFIIMPNHLHGIIIINPINDGVENVNHNVETRRGVSLQGENENKFSKPIKNSLSVIINQFKGSVKRWANKNGYEDFQWQPGFYDRIIRNERELYLIRKYIEQNPLKWEIEKNNPENLEL
ncbi:MULTISPECIES: transposase [Ignavibacterium]|jgi:REP element-mobilizing transposase RayT|uniref:transposase n=1 Tax=Ignavibacterium TaxID=795750 RepID=UPI0025BC3031|nr:MULTISPECIES: transposase [Ignavibacterium]MBI5660762.1 transposase [Ignavibacterium album]